MYQQLLPAYAPYALFSTTPSNLVWNLQISAAEAAADVPQVPLKQTLLHRPSEDVAAAMAWQVCTCLVALPPRLAMPAGQQPRCQEVVHRATLL